MPLQSRVTPMTPPAQRESELDRLLAQVIGRDRPADVAGAARLVRSRGLAVASRQDARRLVLEGGLRRVAAERLAAAFALGRAVERARAPRGAALSSPDAVQRVLAPLLRGVERECFHVLVLDAKHRLKLETRISEGTLTSSLVHPREVFAPALVHSGAALVVAHNHPSGDPEPSVEDLAVTRRLLEAGRLLGIPLLDHVILGEGTCVSLRERMSFA